MRGTKADTTEESAHKATPTAQRHTLPRPDKREALKAALPLSIRSCPPPVQPPAQQGQWAQTRRCCRQAGVQQGRGTKRTPQLLGNQLSTPLAGRQARRQSGQRTGKHARAKATRQRAAPPHKGRGGQAREVTQKGQLPHTLPRPQGRRHTAVGTNTSPDTLTWGATSPHQCKRPNETHLETRAPHMSPHSPPPAPPPPPPSANGHDERGCATRVENAATSPTRKCRARRGGRRRGHHKRERGVRQGRKDCVSPRRQQAIHEPALTSWCR